MECTVSHAVEKINPDEREEMKVSGKVQPLQFIMLYSGSDSEVLWGTGVSLSLLLVMSNSVTKCGEHKDYFVM